MVAAMLVGREGTLREERYPMGMMSSWEDVLRGDVLRGDVLRGDVQGRYPEGRCPEGRCAEGRCPGKIS